MLKPVAQQGILFGRGQSPDVCPTVPSVFFEQLKLL